MKNFITILFIVGSIFYSLNVLAQGVVCRKENIADTRWEYYKAIKTIGKETTTNFTDMKVYISYKTYDTKTYIYCHSNFVTDGFKYPTKILYEVDEIGTDLSSYIQIIAFDRSPSWSDKMRLTKAFDKITIYLDYKVLENQKLAFLNLNDFSNIKIIKGFDEMSTPSHNELLKIQSRILESIEENPKVALKGQYSKTQSTLCRENINRLNIIGEIDAKYKLIDELVEASDDLYKQFQKKYALHQTGKFDIPSENKLIEIEEKLLKEFEILGLNPNNYKELSSIIKDFQKNKSLPITGFFDVETSNQLKSLKNNLTNKLESTINGINYMSLEDKIRLYRDIKKLDNKNAIADKKFWDVINVDNNYYVNVEGNFKAFQKSDISIKNTEGVEIKKLKTIRYEQDANIHIISNDHLTSSIEALNKKLDWIYDLEEIVVFPVTRNSDTRNLLKQKFGKNWIKSNLKSEKEISKELKRSKRKTVLIVGHIENGYFVEGSFKINIETLNKYAKEYNLNIFHLGCSSAMEGAGTTASINTHKTVDALISSIKENNNFKDFFLGFSKKGIGSDNLPIDLLVDGNTFSNKGYAQFKLYQKGSTAGIATAGGGILLYYLLSDDETNNEE